jgi:hypothetical protein
MVPSSSKISFPPLKKNKGFFFSFLSTGLDRALPSTSPGVLGTPSCNLIIEIILLLKPQIYFLKMEEILFC